MFAYPWDLPPDATPVVYGRNLAGTEATGRFWFKLFPKKVSRARLRDQRLLNGKAGDCRFDPTGQLAPGPDLLSPIPQNQRGDAAERTISR